MYQIGVVGCGFFARNHLEAWGGIDDVSVVAVCDLDPARLDRAATRWPGVRGYPDAAGMLARERLDFVDIVTAAPSHRALVEQVAAAGAAVICQKPFAPSLEDARAMVAACARAGVPLMVHENFRFQRPILELKKVVESGRLGAPTYARIRFRHACDIYAGQPYLLEEERLAIMDVGVHLLDVARFLLGEAETVFCRTQRIDPRVAGEDSVSITLEHEGGAVSLVDFSFATIQEPDPFPQTLIRIEGERGTAQLLEGYRLEVSGGGVPIEVRDVEPPVPAWGGRPWHLIEDSVITIQRHWIDCLKTGREPATSGADNLKTLELVFAAYDSASARGTAHQSASALGTASESARAGGGA
ncbi:MAG: Gfo/Idh/MocA family oxidoreductase [Geminicoccaceae bacterium]|nr:Gfo/Idh/MocA family oxidoreductase [Geminicoccaceae bacterium]